MKSFTSPGRGRRPGCGGALNVQGTIETDVLVVGAGPGGSAAAYHLARHGIDVTVVEKAAFPGRRSVATG